MVHDYDRIEHAIHYLDAHFQRQPSLEEIATSVGLSEHHFQRLFTRWAGISPKRFLQFQTVEHAKQLLRASRSVLDATYESGLSSPGRLHDLFVRVEAMTPGEFKRAGSGLSIGYGFHPTPFGEALVAATDRGVCGLWFVRETGRTGAMSAMEHYWRGARLVAEPARTAPLATRIFGDLESGAPLGVVLKGTNFQLKVWEALLRIPEGNLVSYNDVAAAIGRPRAVRAVGNAVGDNPVSYLIPCHRVIRSTGALGGYGGGLARKRAILGWEMGRVAG